VGIKRVGTLERECAEEEECDSVERVSRAEVVRVVCN